MGLCLCLCLLAELNVQFIGVQKLNGQFSGEKMVTGIMCSPRACPTGKASLSAWGIKGDRPIGDPQTGNARRKITHHYFIDIPRELGGEAPGEYKAKKPICSARFG